MVRMQVCRVVGTGSVAMSVIIAASALGLAGCGEPAAPVDPAAARVIKMDTTVPAAPVGAQPRLASDPVQIADDLVADEQAIRDPATREPDLMAAARRQQMAYRVIGRNPGWDAVIRPRIPESLLATHNRNIDARRQLTAMSPVGDTLPAWRIIAPEPAADLLGYYREAEATTDVGWNYLAAVNLVETRFGSIAGVSTAGAQGPMQFMPEPWAAYGKGGDVSSPRESIMAAGSYLAGSGFASNSDQAIYAYNHANEYVSAVKDYAAILADDPGAFGGYFRWQVYYYTTAGEVLLPVGYAESQRIPVSEYLATHPNNVSRPRHRRAGPTHR